MYNHAKEVKPNVTFRFDPNLVICIIIPPQSSSPNARLKSTARSIPPAENTEEKKKANITIGIDTTISWPGSVIDVHYIGSTQGYVVVERWQAQKEPREV